MKNILLIVIALFALFGAQLGSMGQSSTSRQVLQNAGTYSAGASYHQSDVVLYNGVEYISLSGVGNIGQTPVNSPVYWNPILPGFFNYGSLMAYGDSLTQGTGASNFMAQGSLSTSYANILIASIGGGQNYGYGGDQAADMQRKVYANVNTTTANNPIVTMMASTNDQNHCGSSAGCLYDFQRAMESAIGWASIPDANKTLISNSSLCTLTGSGDTPWALDSGGTRTTYFTNVAGATATCTTVVPAGGSKIYFSYTACDAYSAGSATIKIDGVTPSNDATVYSYGFGGAAINTSNGWTCTHFLSRYAATPGTHTFLITATGGGALANIFEPDWIGSPAPSAPNVQAPPIVFVGGTPWVDGDSSTTDGYAIYDTLIQSIVTSMANDGSPVYFVNVRTGSNTRNSATATPLNSTTDFAGGQQGDVTCPASWLPPYHPNSAPTPFSMSCGHGHLAGVFAAAMGLKIGGPAVSAFVYGKPLAPNGMTDAGNGTSTFGYGFSLNGDMREGSEAGCSFGYTGDPLMHCRVPTLAGGFSLEAGNSPAPGIAPTINSLFRVLGAGSTVPSGSCTGLNGLWEFTADGHVAYCNAGTWATKI